MKQHTQRELDILGHFQLNANRAVSEVARLSGYQGHVVSRAIRKFEASTTVVKYGAIDFSTLGLQETLVRFSLGSVSAEQREAFLSDLRGSQGVIWLSSTGGSFQYLLSLLARNQFEVLEFLEKISDRHSKVFAMKSLGLVAQHTYYGRRYLSPAVALGDAVELHSNRPTQHFNEKDHLVLRALSQNYRAPLRDLAQKLGIPASTVSFHIRKLESEGVITRYLYSVNPAQFQLHRSHFFVYTSGMNSDLTARLRRFCMGHLNIISLYRTLGEWDYGLRIEAEKGETLAHLQQELLTQFSGEIVRIDSVPTLSVLSLQNYPIQSYSFLTGAKSSTFPSLAAHS